MAVHVDSPLPGIPVINGIISAFARPVNVATRTSDIIDVAKNFALFMEKSPFILELAAV